MANICANEFFIYGDDPTEVLALYYKLRDEDPEAKGIISIADLISKFSGGMDYASGAVIYGIMLQPKYLDADHKKTDATKPVYGVSIYAESRWSPCDVDVETMVRYAVPDHHLKIVLLAEEPGCGIYINTDVNRVFFYNKAKIDKYVPEHEYEQEYFYDTPEDEKRFLEQVAAYTGIKCKSYDEVAKLSPDTIRDAFYKNAAKKFKKYYAEDGCEPGSDEDEMYFYITFYDEY